MSGRRRVSGSPIREATSRDAALASVGRALTSHGRGWTMNRWDDLKDSRPDIPQALERLHLSPDGEPVQAAAARIASMASATPRTTMPGSRTPSAPIPGRWPPTPYAVPPHDPFHIRRGVVPRHPPSGTQSGFEEVAWAALASGRRCGWRDDSDTPVCRRHFPRSSLASRSSRMASASSPNPSRPRGVSTRARRICVTALEMAWAVSSPWSVSSR